MAKRYGRNQKRKARAHAEALQQALTMQYSLAREMSARISRIDKQLQNCARVLGVGFIGLEPEIYRLRDKMNTETMRAITADGAIVNLARMDTRVSTDSRPTHMLHFRLYLGGVQVSYAITHQALRDAPKEIIIQELSREMATQFVESYRAKNLG